MFSLTGTSSWSNISMCEGLLLVWRQRSCQIYQLADTKNSEEIFNQQKCYKSKLWKSLNQTRKFLIHESQFKQVESLLRTKSAICCDQVKRSSWSQPELLFLAWERAKTPVLIRSVMFRCSGLPGRQAAGGEDGGSSGEEGGPGGSAAPPGG